MAVPGTFAAYDAKDRDWRKEGVVSIRRPDGSEQAREYFCRGYEVGFHRYFDVKGEPCRHGGFPVSINLWLLVAKAPSSYRHPRYSPSRSMSCRE
jgi:hypothetical protein